MTGLAQNIEHLTPTTEAELAHVYKDFKYFWHFIEYDRPSEAEFKEWLHDVLPGATLIYCNSIPLACFMVVEANESAQLHGMVRPDYKKLLPGGKTAFLEIQKQVLAWIFFTLDKKKVIFKAQPGNRGVMAFARTWGARKLENKDKGDTVYVIDVETFVDKIRI